MHELIYLLIAGGLGVLWLILHDWVRRKQRKKELVTSVVNELVEHQYIMALVAFKMRVKASTLPDEFLDWLLLIFSSYSGPDKDSTFEATIANIRELSEGDRRQFLTDIQDKNQGFIMKQYELPFLAAQTNELSICSPDFQSRVSRVMTKLRLFNQDASFLQGAFDKTFDSSVVGANRDAVKKNLTEGYARIGTKAEDMAKMIGEIISRYGSP